MKEIRVDDGRRGRTGLGWSGVCTENSLHDVNVIYGFREKSC